MTLTTVELDDALRRRLERLASLRQKPAGVVMREAIAQYVELEEARQSFVQEAEDSWSHYQRTDLHLTGDELNSWLKTWGTEVDSEPPECHTKSSLNARGWTWSGAGFGCLHAIARQLSVPARSSPDSLACCKTSRRSGVQ